MDKWLDPKFNKKHTKIYFDDNDNYNNYYKPKKHSDFGRYIFYTVLLIIIFLVIYLIFFRTSLKGEIVYKAQDSITNFYDDTKEIMNLNEEGSKNLDIKDFNKNQQSYMGKKVIAKGELGHYVFKETENCGGIYYLSNDEGYEIMFCPSIGRSWEMGKTYTIEGTIVTEHGIGWVNEGKDYIVIMED